MPLGSCSGDVGSLTVPCVILSHLHLFHAVGREPARAAFHGPLPETALPNAEHWRDRSQTAVRVQPDTQEPTPPTTTSGSSAAHHPPPSAFLSFSPLFFLHPPGFFPGKILGSTQQTEMNRWTQHRIGMWRTERHTDGHTRGGTTGRGRGHKPAPALPVDPSPPTS